MKNTVEVHWDINVQCGRHICSEAYASNVIYMYASAFGYIIDYRELIWSLYIDRVVLYMYMK